MCPKLILFAPCTQNALCHEVEWVVKPTQVWMTTDENLCLIQSYMWVGSP